MSDLRRCAFSYVWRSIFVGVTRSDRESPVSNWRLRSVQRIYCCSRAGWHRFGRLGSVSESDRTDGRRR